MEYGGPADAIAGALPRLMEQEGLRLTGLSVKMSDQALLKALHRAKVRLDPSKPNRTQLIVNPQQLFNRLRPRLTRMAGPECASVEVMESAEGYVLRCASAEVRLAGAPALAEFVFGEPVQPRGKLGKLLNLDAPSPVPSHPAFGRALPLPALWYGINFV